MSEEQMELVPERTVSDSVRQDVHLMVELLRGDGWRSARSLAKFCGWTDRYVRRLAAASDGRIISGQQGYRLTLEATPEEIAHAADWYRSQARKMIVRSMQIRRLAHGAIR